MRLLAGIDLGSTAIKGILINENGVIQNTCNLSARYEYPQDGFVEFSSESFYNTFCLLTKKLLDKAKASDQLVSIAISGASGNTLLLDNNNQPIQNTISWLDTRPVDFSEVYSDKLSKEDIHDIIGWPSIQKFPFAHMLWLKKESHKEFDSASRYMMNITYLYYRLTGKFVMDNSTATTFYLQDQKSGKWHKQLLDSLGITESKLPELVPSGSLAGEITQQAAIETGFPTDTKIVLGSFDHPAAARGTGVLQEGSLMLSCGTSWVGFYPINNRDIGIKNKMLVDPFLSPDGPWAAMFSLSGIGKSIDVIVNHLVGKNNLNAKYKIFSQRAAQSSVGANNVTFDIIKPIEQLIIDVKELEKKEDINDIYRALMEVVAYEIKLRLLRYGDMGLKTKEITMVGGAAENRLWSQILADITEQPIRLLNGQVAGALGSTIMAGIGVGLFKNEKDGFAKVGGKPVFVNPIPQNSKMYKSFHEKYINKYRKNND